MPVEACSLKLPLSSVGRPQQYSITSSPRATSPIASDRTLPCSAVRRRARSSRWASKSSVIGGRVAWPGMDAPLLELAEEPGLWLPPEPTHDVVFAESYCLVTYGRSAWVHRIRLGSEDVERAVEEVRALLRARGLDEVTWWVGERSTPADLAARLEALGLEADDPPKMTTLTIEREPAGTPAVEVCRVKSLEDYLTALEIDWEAFEIAEAERRDRRPAARTAWPLIVADGRSSVYLAYL